MVLKKGKYEVPDGGWGWFVVFAYALNNFITIPILQGFGLIWKDRLQALGISVTDMTVITNVNSAFGFIMGLANGPLIRSYGYRKLALGGALLYAGGVMATAFATTFAQFIFFYGMICSYGMGLSMLSYGIALNSYFQKRRSQAVSTYVTITGLGPILMPSLQSTLLSNYGTQGTMLILGALSLHSVIGATLLQPVKWHAKKIKPQPEELSEQNDEVVALHVPDLKTEKKVIENHTNQNLEEQEQRRTITISNLDHDAETGSVYGYETPMSTNRRFSAGYYKSSDGINLGSSFGIFDYDNIQYRSLEFNSSDESSKPIVDKKLESASDGVNINDKEKSNWNKWLQSIVHFFDLDLLRDATYVNLMLGLSIAILAEMNFSMLTPFILSEMSLSTNQIAIVMSVIGTGDLIFRAISSYLGKWINQSFQMMCLYSLMMLIACRTSLIFAENYSYILGVAVFLGIAKGVRSVYMPLVIPEYIKSVERLASASSIQMLVNGCFLICAGPLIGVIRDYSSSYIPCIGFINAVTLLTIVMWLTEIVYRKIKKKRKHTIIT